MAENPHPSTLQAASYYGVDGSGCPEAGSGGEGSGNGVTGWGEASGIVAGPGIGAVGVSREPGIGAGV